MRLIDADKMLERLQEWNTSDDMDKALYRFAFSRIMEQPTAYDADKVVEKLEAEGNKIEIQYEYNYEKGLLDGIGKAIEIIKVGGKDE